MLASRLRTLGQYQRELGARCGIHWYVLQSLNWRGKLKAPVTIRPSRLDHKVLLRMGSSSDLDVFRQIFLKNEYAFIDSFPQVRTVVDLGANIGLASALFLSRWPGVSVLAVEPDPDNCQLLKRNLSPYGERALILQAAVWARSGELELSHDFGDGREWAVAVQERSGAGEGVQAFSMPELLARVPGFHIDLLKIDIEGSEQALFNADTGWLAHVSNLSIELHGPACEQAFRNALRGYAWDESRCGEYVVCRHLRRMN